MDFKKLVVVVDVTTLKMTRKPMKLYKENPAGCAGEGKESKGNIVEEIRTVYSANFILR